MRKTLLTKLMLLVAVVLMGAGMAWAEDKTSTLTFTATCGGSGTADDGAAWTVTSDGDESNFDNTKGIHYGTNSKAVQYIKLSTSDIDGTITKVVVNASTASGVSATVGVTVGGNVFGGDAKTLSNSAADYTFEGSAEGEIIVTVTKPSSAAKAIYVKSVVVTYTAGGGGDTPTLEDSDFALTDAPVALTFDLYNNSTAQTISYTTSSTGTVTVSESEYVSAVVDDDAKTITVTPLKKTGETQTITISQAADETYAAGEATFAVTISDSKPKTGAWEKVDISDLAEGDVFVIVGDNGKTYAMSNDNGTSSAPSAVEVTVEENEITSDVEDNVKWNIGVSVSSAQTYYTFYPNGSTDTWLYCTNTNNGVRVGTNDNNKFQISDEGYLKLTALTRFVGIYSSQDWRCYSSINSNIKDQSFAYYRYVDNAAVKAPVITVDATFVGSTTATITCATDGAAIYYSYDGENWTEYTEALAITATTTIYAKAVKGEDESKVVSKTTTKVLATPTVTIDATGITNTDVYTGTAAGTLAAAVSYEDADVEGATVVWSGDNDDVATIDAATGEITLVAAGTVTFTATYAGSADYNEATATYELTVTNSDPNAPGTENNPYTVAEAIAATPTSGTSDNVYIKGIVSSFHNTSIIGDGNNYRYNISDDGTTDTQLLVYRGKGLNNETFSNADDLQIGDEVVILGGLTMYDNAPEIAANNYIVSLNRPVDTTPSIEVSETTIEAPAAGADGTITVTYNNIAEVAADVYFCDADGNAATYDWLTAEINRENNVEYLIDANTGEARTAYMKVYALDDNANEVYSELITITQAKYVAPDVEVEPAVAGVGAFVKVTSTEDITAGNYLIVYEGGDSHDAVAFNGGLQTLDAANNGIKVDIADGKIPATDALVAATFTLQASGSLKSASGLYIGKAAYSNGLDAEESILANTFSIDDDGNAVITAEGGCTLRYNYASDQLRFRYYKSGQQAIQLYKYDETATPTITAKVTAAGYATFCSEYALDFSAVEGLTAYKATVTDKQVSFTKVDEVPARQGVLLKGNEDTYIVPVIASASAIDNDLIGVTEQTTVSETGIYVLMAGTDSNQGTGFYKTTQAFTVGAHTAYLPASAGGAARTFIGFDFNETTGIEGIAAEKATNGEIYNLQGQRVAKAQKGLYIVGGKKVLVK